MGERGADQDALSDHLKALAHPSRLELLSQLRVPRTLNEIKLRPQRDEAEGNPDRLISRNAAERHLQLLVAIGVVVRREGVRDGRKVDEYTLQHAKLFQVLEELRDLTLLRPVELVDIERTEGDRSHVLEMRDQGPRLVVLSGPAEGRAYPLPTRGGIVIGRAPPADVVLDHDPYVSVEHARIEVSPEGRTLLRDLPTNRNGSLLNWRHLARGQVAPLRAGDVLKVGRTLLLYQDLS